MGPTMTRKGSSQAPTRPASARRVLLLVLAVVIGVPVWLAMVAGVAILALVRPIAAPVSGLILAGAAIAAIYFATQGHWPEAIRFAAGAAVAGAVFFAMTAFGDRLGMDSGPRYPAPPWWWFV